MSKRVLYISQEIFPYLPESEVANLSRHLPQLIQELGNEVRMFMPKFGVISERRNQLHEVIRLSGINLIINNSDHQLIIKVASIPTARMQVYFIDNVDFFKRKSLYGPTAQGVNDNDARSIFFVRGALETVKKLRWMPDIIHCHGWFTALAMLYLKKVYHDDPALKKAKLVFSLYNEEPAGEIPDTLFEKLKFDNIKTPSVASMKGETNLKALYRLAIQHAHGVVQASESIDADLLDFVQENGKAFLPYPGSEDYAKAYDEFYNQLL